LGIDLVKDIPNAKISYTQKEGSTKGTRELVIVRTPYIAAYRVKKESIQILRVLLGARLWPDKL
jgi:plasmid stabilization system protein ParE